MDGIMRRYLTKDEQAKLLGTIKQFASVQARRDRAWIQLMLATGFRVGEFSRLTVKQARVALETMWLFIPKEKRKGWNRKPRVDRHGKPVTAKPPPDHYLPVTEPVREALRALLKIAAEMGGDTDDAAPLVLSRKHRAMSVRGFQDRFAVWCRAAGIEASPHWLRHTRAIKLLRETTSNDPLGVVQAGLGHASRSSSAIYTRMTKEDLARELNAIDGPRRASKAAVRAMFESPA